MKLNKKLGAKASATVGSLAKLKKLLTLHKVIKDLRQAVSTKPFVTITPFNAYIKSEKESPSLTYLIHGFNVEDGGAHTTSKLIDPIASYTNGLNIVSYGWFGVFSVMLKNRQVAESITNSIVGSILSRPLKDLRYPSEALPINLVGHSNGAAIIVLVLKQLRTYDIMVDNVVLINPALPAKLNFPSSCKQVTVFYTKQDKATRAARLLNKIPFIELLVPDSWGAMGAVGSLTNQTKATMPPIVYNVNMSNKWLSHSDAFSQANYKHTSVLVTSALFPTVADKEITNLLKEIASNGT